jgi:RNA-binding protein
MAEGGRPSASRARMERMRLASGPRSEYSRPLVRDSEVTDPNEDPSAPASEAEANAPVAPARRRPPAPALNGKQRRHLRALAHPLVPVVQVGQKGVSPAVLAQIDDALDHHELIKVKLGKNLPGERGDAAPEVAAQLACAVVQTIGRVVVLYRPAPEPEDRRIHLPG